MITVSAYGFTFCGAAWSSFGALLLRGCTFENVKEKSATASRKRHQAVRRKPRTRWRGQELVSWKSLSSWLVWHCWTWWNPLRFFPPLSLSLSHKKKPYCSGPLRAQIITVQQSTTLELWSRNMDLWLNCFQETWMTRDWDAYHLEADQIICDATGVTWTQNDLECTSPCIFIDDIPLSVGEHAEGTACSILNATGLDNAILSTDNQFSTWIFCQWSVDFVLLLLLWEPRDTLLQVFFNTLFNT
jgi:hypothetical protein